MDANFKCGFAAIVGKPNVGKSTLMNAILGEKLSIISPKPQTTRQNIKGIYSDDTRQIIFLDTPGFLQPRYELHEKMRSIIQDTLGNADVVLFVTDAPHFPTDYDKEFIEIIKHIRAPRIALLNKIDLVEDYTESMVLLGKSFDQVLPISAKTGTNMDKVLDLVSKYLPYSPPHYDPEDLSDQPMRFFAQEIIREKIMLNFKEEIPYASAVIITHFRELEDKVDIEATIWIERDSQKPILIGKNGSMIAKIRTAAEKDLEKMIGMKVFLHLFVKINKNWRKNKHALKELGFQ
ncbi:MAG TPA: GTPase Era [Candidatus Cloacimonadota bacterium]|nr:GTPase Era [Candidatus Cloacimonadota bacterium]